MYMKVIRASINKGTVYSKAREKKTEQFVVAPQNMRVANIAILINGLVYIQC